MGATYLFSVYNFQMSFDQIAKSLQSCPTLCDPIDGSPPGSPVSGILQARTLERVAISFSNAWKWKVKVKLLSRVRLGDPMDCSLPGSSIHGIFQARVPEWVAIAFSERIQAFHPNLKIPTMWLQPIFAASSSYQYFLYLQMFKLNLTRTFSISCVMESGSLCSRSPNIFSGGKVCFLPNPALLVVLLEPNSFLKQLDFPRCLAAYIHCKVTCRRCQMLTREGTLEMN